MINYFHNKLCSVLQYILVWDCSSVKYNASSGPVAEEGIKTWGTKVLPRPKGWGCFGFTLVTIIAQNQVLNIKKFHNTCTISTVFLMIRGLTDPWYYRWLVKGRRGACNKKVCWRKTAIFNWKRLQFAENFCNVLYFLLTKNWFCDC